MKIEPKFPARWAITRFVGKVRIDLIERTRILGEWQATLALEALGLGTDEGARDHYFPRNAAGDRCPTYALIALWYEHGQEGETGLSASV